MSASGAGYLERLASRSASIGTVLCVGLDPDPEALPAGLPKGLAGVEAFAGLILEATAPFAAAVKPNLAFFEAFGSGGLAALERIRARVPAGVLVVIDAKRGDIGSTSTRHAAALFDGLGADAVTVSPYLGEEAIGPLIERGDRFAYVLCRTSNPGAGELQDLIVESDAGAPGEPLWARVARRAADWGPGSTIGLVVGATAPAELAAIRGIAPGLPMLVPGVGAQGGSLEAVLDKGRATASPAGDRAGGGLLVNVSRGIAAAALEAAVDAGSTDVLERLAEAARTWSQRLPVLTLAPAGPADPPRAER